MSQMSEAQLAAGPASESTFDERLGTSIYLCECTVSFNLCMSSRFTLTVSDINGMVPRSRIVANRYMCLFHTYSTRENQDFDDRQMYRYSFPEVRMTSYRSNAVGRR